MYANKICTLRVLKVYAHHNDVGTNPHQYFMEFMNHSGYEHYESLNA